MSDFVRGLRAGLDANAATLRSELAEIDETIAELEAKRPAVEEHLARVEAGREALDAGPEQTADPAEAGAKVNKARKPPKRTQRRRAKAA